MTDLPLLWLVCAPVGLVLYSYIGYPLILALLRPKKIVELPNLTDASAPMVTILVAAHNEASVIAGRVENALASDYPGKLIEVLIASDGSTDNTENIVCGFADSRVRLEANHPNRGKSYTLNRALKKAKGSIVVMSDANTEFDAKAVQQLVRRLLAPDRPRAVCGKLVLSDPVTGDNVDGLYWRYESWLKVREGALGVALGANGGIYAFRKDDYCPIPDNTILDDMSIPLLMKLQRGGSIVFEASAFAREEVPPNIADEFGRRVRLGIGAFQSLGFLWPLLNPRHGLSALAFWSHKVLRWLTPHLLVVAVLGASLNSDEAYSREFLLAVFVCLALSWCGRFASGSSYPARFLRLANLFVSMNAALGVGFFRWLVTAQSGTWKRTTRESG